MSEMKDTGWGVLAILVLVLCCMSTGWGTILILGLVFWMVSSYKKTGKLPDVAKDIENLFVDKDKKDE